MGSPVVGSWTLPDGNAWWKGLFWAIDLERSMLTWAEFACLMTSSLGSSLTSILISGHRTSGISCLVAFAFYNTVIDSSSGDLATGVLLSSSLGTFL